MTSSTHSARFPRRRLGTSRAEVDIVGLGTGPLGNMFAPLDEQGCASTVDAALTNGIKTFDTAPHYGLGLAETRLGRLIHDKRDEVVVITKVGRMLDPAPPGWEGEPNELFIVPPTHKRRWDFSAQGVRQSIEGSLERLGTSKVDIVLLHDPENHMDQAIREGIPALAELRAAGVVDAIGVGTKDSACLARCIETGLLDVALMAGRYTLLHQGAIQDVFPAAAKTGTSILMASVFNSGLLASHEVKDNIMYDYRPAPPEIIARARAIAAICERFDTTLPAAAMQFPLCHQSVAGLIVGARTASEVETDIGFLERPIDPDFWKVLQKERILDEGVAIPTAA